MTPKIDIVETHWHECERAVLMADGGAALIEVQYPRDCPDLGYIWHLWVAEDRRGEGLGKAMLNAAERHIIGKGKTKAVLTWDSRDTPQWVRDWYKRNGYRQARNPQLPKYQQDLLKRLITL